VTAGCDASTTKKTNRKELTNLYSVSTKFASLNISHQPRDHSLHRSPGKLTLTLPAWLRLRTRSVKKINRSRQFLQYSPFSLLFKLTPLSLPSPFSCLLLPFTSLFPFPLPSVGPVIIHTSLTILCEYKRPPSEFIFLCELESGSLFIHLWRALTTAIGSVLRGATLGTFAC